MSELPVDLLEAFSGYLALEMFEEANDELENLPAELKAHPAVQAANLDLLMEMKRWKDASVLGELLLKRWPEICEFHVRTAFCLHEMKRTTEARQTLVSGPESLRKQAVFYYNMACYESQLGNLAEAKRQLAICFKMDDNYKHESLDDPDLEPIWDAIKAKLRTPRTIW